MGSDAVQDQLDVIQGLFADDRGFAEMLGGREVSRLTDSVSAWAILRKTHARNAGVSPK